MSGYVEAGWSIGLGTLAAYAATLVMRERAARRRLARIEPSPSADGADPPEPGAGGE